MPWEVLWEPRGVLRRFVGRVDGEQLLRSVAEVHGDWRFDTPHYSINDFLAVESLELDQQALEQAAAETIGASQSNGRLVVLIVARDPHVVDIARRFTSPPLANYPAHFFDSIEEARAWVADHLS
jgi:hypothetical protein